MNFKVCDFSPIHKYEEPEVTGYYASLPLGQEDILGAWYNRPDMVSQYLLCWWDGEQWLLTKHGGTCVTQQRCWFGLKKEAHDGKK